MVGGLAHEYGIKETTNCYNLPQATAIRKASNDDADDGFNAAATTAVDAASIAIADAATADNGTMNIAAAAKVAAIATTAETKEAAIVTPVETKAAVIATAANAEAAVKDERPYNRNRTTATAEAAFNDNVETTVKPPRSYPSDHLDVHVEKTIAAFKASTS